MYGFITAPWDRTIVLKVPVATGDAKYRYMVGYFEHADGCPNFAGVRLQILPFDVALMHIIPTSTSDSDCR